MSKIYTDLNTVLTPYATAIKKNASDITSLNGSLGEVKDSTTIIKELNISSYPTENRAISASNYWSTGGKSKTIPVSGFLRETLTITSNATNGSVICFLKSNGNTVDYATGTSRTFVAANTTRTFDIPTDCNFINIMDNWSGDYLPQKVEVRASAIQEIENKITIEDKIGLTTNDWIDKQCIIATYYNNAGDNQQGTVSSAGSSLKASGFIPVSGAMLEFPMMSNTEDTYPNYGMSLYDKNKNPIIGRAITASKRGIDDNYAAWTRVYLPKNAKYFRTTYWSDNSSIITNGYAEEFTYNLLAEIPDEYKPITHELPVDTYMQNSIRRARQLTDIKWTPRVKIPRYSMMAGGLHFLDWFYPDKEYVGIPYSGAGKREGVGDWTAPEEWGYAHNWVGGCIPFDAFVTAARYPNSIFSETTEQSQADYDSSPFGIVCTALVNYAVNGPLPLRGISGFFDTSDKVFRKKTTNNTLRDLDANIMIGDFMYTAPHVIMITDIIRDEEGNITHIEMSEATTVGNNNNSVLGTKFGGVARRKVHDYTALKNSGYGSYVVYRRVSFYGIPYEACNYVDTGNEGDRETVIDYPCIPYLGNGAVYKYGYIHNSKILIGATGYTSLVVKKDGEDFGTFNCTGLTEVSVGFSEIGEYTAYLTNGTYNTASCKWSVVA